MNSRLIRHVKEICKNTDSPFYIYDKDLLNHKVNVLRESLPSGSIIHFATMANDNHEIWKILKKSGINLFIPSLNHLKLALKIGFLPEQLFYSSPVFEKNDVQFLTKLNIKFTINSIDQFKSFIKSNTSKQYNKIGVRINFKDYDEDESSPYLGSNSRFGIFADEFEEFIDLTKNADININGLQMFVGTNIMFYPKLIVYYEKLIQFAKCINSIEYLDFGGGFGIPYKMYGKKDFEWNSFSKELTKIIKQYNYLDNIDLIFEPGRSLIADAGFLITRVLDVIRRNENFFIFTDVNISMFPRPHIYEDAYHHIEVLPISKNQSQELVIADICGNSIYARDILAKNIQLKLPKINDLLIIYDTGAYCYSMRSKFLGMNSPKQFLVSKESIREI